MSSGYSTSLLTWIGRGSATERISRSSTASSISPAAVNPRDRKSTRLNSSHVRISYAVFCLKKKKNRRSFAGKDALLTDGQRGNCEGIVRWLASDVAAVELTNFKLEYKAKRLTSELHYAC